MDGSLPPGFTLDQQQAVTPSVPDGFTLDQQASTPLLPKTWSDAGNQAMTGVGLAGRYAIEGLSNPFGIGDAANSAINAFLPQDKQLGMPSQTISDALTKVGFPQPQGAMQNVVGDMSRALAGTGGGIGLAESAGSKMLAPLIQNPVMQARAAVGASGAAGTTRELGGGPVAQTLAGLAGGYAATRTPFAKPLQEQSLSSGLRSDARVEYQDAKDIGATLNSDVSKSVPQLIEQNFADTGKMNARLHGDTLGILDDLKADAEKGSLSLEDLHQYRQLFGDVINKNLHPNGAMMPDAMKANQAIDTIDSIIDAAAGDSKMLESGSPDAIKAWQKGQNLWRQSNQANDIERIMQRAETMENPATALRSGFRQLLNNPKRFNKFSPEQQTLIRNAANVSMPVEVLRGLSSRLISAIMAGTGNIGGSMLAQGAQSIPRNVATRMQMARGQNVINSIARPNNLMQPLPDVSNRLGAMQGIMQTGRQ